MPCWRKPFLLRLAFLVGLGSGLWAVVGAIQYRPGQASRHVLQAGGAPATPQGSGTEPRNRAQEAGPAVNRPISPETAVAIAEKTADGRAIRVDRHGEGAATRFEVDVQRSGGKTLRVRLSASGSVLQTADAASAPEGKSKDIKGTVKATDPRAQTITLALREKGQEREATYRLASDARLAEGPRTLLFSDIRLGARVRALLGSGDLIVELRLEK